MAKTKKKTLQELTLEELSQRQKGVSTIFYALAAIFGLMILIAIGTVFYLDLEMKKALPMLVAVLGGSLTLLPLLMVKRGVDAEMAKRGE